MKKIIKSANKGLTLVEVLVAAAALGLIMTAMVSLVSRSLSSTIFSREESSASQYAQEGLETARKLRDDLGWEAFDTAYPDNASFCLTNASLEPSLAPGNVCSNCGAITGTAFKRCLQFYDEIVSGRTLKKVKVTVSWEDQGKSHQDTSITYLTNWR